MNKNQDVSIVTGGGKESSLTKSISTIDSDNHSLYIELENLLRMESAYCAEDGVLLKNSIVEAAFNLDSQLLKLLIKSGPLKNHFFEEIDGILVFDKIKFQKFLTDEPLLPEDINGNPFHIERFKALRQWIPEAFAEGKLDWEKLKLSLGDDINTSNERYTLNWAGKSNAFRTLQQPSSGTLIPVKEESVDFDNTRNIFIEGENMEVLKILQKSYFGKVKMIYIDPPYNTGNDSFIYPDRFAETKEEYLKRIGDKTEDGFIKREGFFRKNSKENGHYHSNWLNMMMPRLYLARSLLRDDGVIFISIDDHEAANLKLLCDEVFGEENFVAQIPWRKRTAKSDVPFGVSQDYEWILCYAKSNNFNAGIKGGKRKYYETPDLPGKPWRIHDLTKQTTAAERPNSFFTLTNPKNGENFPANPNATWRITEETFEEYYRANRIVFPGDYDFLKISRPVLRYFKDDDQVKAGDRFGFVSVSTNLPQDIGMTKEGTTEITDLFDGKVFNFPKPINLIKHLINTTTSVNTQNSDVVLDFFSGSATTAHAVMQLNREDGGNRQYICIQLAEPCNEDTTAFQAGYRNICEIGKERIRLAAQKIRREIEAEQEKLKGQLELNNTPSVIPDLGFKVFKLADSNFKQWPSIPGSDSNSWKQQMIDFINPLVPDTKTENIEYELLLKSGKDLNSRIERKNGYSMINGKEMALVLERITQETIDVLLAKKPEKIIALDKLFENNDQLKTNMALQMKDAGIQFRTI